VKILLLKASEIVHICIVSFRSLVQSPHRFSNLYFTIFLSYKHINVLLIILFLSNIIITELFLSVLVVHIFFTKHNQFVRTYLLFFLLSFKIFIGFFMEWHGLQLPLIPDIIWPPISIDLICRWMRGWTVALHWWAFLSDRVVCIIVWLSML